MSLLKRLQDVVTDTALLLIDTNNRFRDALGRINHAPPLYTANDLTTDVTQTALRTLQLMMKFWTPLSDPLLPTVTISYPANLIPGNIGLHATVSLTASVPLYMSPSVTPLVFMGWSVVPGPTDASQVPPLAAKSPIPDTDLDVLRQQIDVTLNVPMGYRVERGTYQGFVLLGQDPVAVVVVRAL
jgi:hypothetical protein